MAAEETPLETCPILSAQLIIENCILSLKRCARKGIGLQVNVYCSICCLYQILPREGLLNSIKCRTIFEMGITRGWISETQLRPN